MPELPDLNVFASNLNKRFGGRRMTDIKSINTKRFNSSETEARRMLGQSLLQSAYRNGKEVEFVFSNNHKLRVHLMLKGYFQVSEDDPTAVKFARIALEFDESAWLIVADPQGWATTELDPDDAEVPDALSKELTFSIFDIAISNYGRKPIKSLLLDQGVLRGIGNAYADEILFAAKVAPASTCSAIPADARRTIYQSIRRVLEESTLELKKRHPDIVGGEFREFLKVHRKDLEVTHEGETIKKEKIASKSSYFTDSQTLYK